MLPPFFGGVAGERFSLTHITSKPTYDYSQQALFWGFYKVSCFTPSANHNQNYRHTNKRGMRIETVSVEEKEKKRKRKKKKRGPAFPRH